MLNEASSSSDVYFTWLPLERSVAFDLKSTGDSESPVRCACRCRVSQFPLKALLVTERKKKKKIMIIKNLNILILCFTS